MYRPLVHVTATVLTGMDLKDPSFAPLSGVCSLILIILCVEEISWLAYSFEKCDEFNDTFLLCEMGVARNGSNEWKR